MEQRLIDANNLYNLLEARYKNSYGSAHRTWGIAIDYVCDAPTIKSRPVVHGRWIPVTDRIPDSQEDVLVVAFWHERWQTMIGWNSDSGKKWRIITPHGEREPGGVTHWMPLPEPPEEG